MLRRAAAALAVVLLLVAAAVGADRFARARAQEVARAAVTRELPGAVGTPVVDIEGFPFLTQLAAGRLDHVTGRLDGATLGGLPVEDLQLDARGIVLTRPRSVDEVTLAATVPAATLRTLLARSTGMTDLQVAVQNGALAVGVERLGVNVQVIGTPTVREGGLRVQVTQVRLGPATIDAADLPAPLRALTDLAVPVSGLPDGLELTGAQVVPAGVRVQVGGSHVPIPASAG